jgi:uncharacterized membrane protein
MDWIPNPSLLLALASGIVLAATCGLRAFLPLLALGLAARFGSLTLAASMDWLRSDLALVALAVATVAEIAGDKVPALDHALDMLGIAVRPLAAVFGSYAVLAGWPHPWGPLVAVALGGLALGVQGVKAKTRLGSSALTLGQANPLLSLGEDVLAAVGTLLALVVPVIALTLTAIAVWLILGRRRPRAAATVVAERRPPA